MSLIEDLKVLPKIDLHINLLSSLSIDFVSKTNELSYEDILDLTCYKKYYDDQKSLELPKNILSDEKNIREAIQDLIIKNKENNVVYSEVYLDPMLYNRDLNYDYTLSIIDKVVNEEHYPLKIVLILSDKFTKEENLNIVELGKKYNNLVTAYYFNKDKMTNLSDYDYLFDKIKRDELKYIVSYDSKVTGLNRDIYSNAYRLIINEEFNEDILELIKVNNIICEFQLSKLNNYNDLYHIIDTLIDNNYLVTNTTNDRTIMNTDMLNESCILFNNANITLRVYVKEMIMIIKALNLNDSEKDKLIEIITNLSNDIL